MLEHPNNYVINEHRWHIATLMIVYQRLCRWPKTRHNYKLYSVDWIYLCTPCTISHSLYTSFFACSCSFHSLNTLHCRDVIANNCIDISCWELCVNSNYEITVGLNYYFEGRLSLIVCSIHIWKHRIRLHRRSQGGGVGAYYQSNLIRGHRCMWNNSDLLRWLWIIKWLSAWRKLVYPCEVLTFYSLCICDH